MTHDRAVRSGDTDAPSAAVLDELLHAFSADTTDRERLAQIDLTSPEVAELIDPSPSKPRPEPEGEAPREVQAEPEPEPDDASAAGEPPAAIDPLLQPAAPDDAEAQPAPNVAGPTTIVISADDADVPDPVYVEGSLEAGGGRSTVFIDDTSGTSREDALTASKIEPKLRHRRIAVRRAKGRRRLRWVIVATVVLALVVAALAVLGSSWFAVSAVEVEGVTYSDREAVDAVVEDLLGTPVLRADTERAEADLEAIPWVDEAIVTTDFPNGARIEISERQPVVTFQGPDQRFRVIDREGRVLDIVAGQPIDYLRVDSPDPPDVPRGAFAPRGYAAAGALVDALTPMMRSRARSVFVTADGGDLRLELAGEIEVRFGRGDDLINKLVRLQTILDGSVVENPSRIDVSTSQVVVE